MQNQRHKIVYLYICVTTQTFTLKKLTLLKLNIQNETSRLRAVVLGTAASNGPVPKIEDAYDPKSIEHIKAGTYPKESDMILEMEAVAKVLKKYEVKNIPARNHRGLQPNFCKGYRFGYRR